MGYEHGSEGRPNHGWDERGQEDEDTKEDLVERLRNFEVLFEEVFSDKVINSEDIENSLLEFQGLDKRRRQLDKKRFDLRGYLSVFLFH